AASITTDSGSGGDATGYMINGSTNYPWRAAGYLAPSTGVIIDGITARYLNHFTDVSGHFFLQWGTASGIVLSGTGHTIRNSTLEKTAGNGVLLQGEGHIAFNNTLNDISYGGVDTAAINTVTAVHTTYPNGRSTDHDIGYNTVRRTGRSGITPRNFANSNAAGGQFKARIHHNDVSYFGIQDWDVGGLYTAASDGKFLRIDHNLFYEGRGYISAGIYLDFARNYIVDHNVVWNVEWGLKFYGSNGGVNNTLAYNNTSSVRNLSSATNGPFAIGNGKETNVGTVLRNNILHVVTPPSANYYQAITTGTYFSNAEIANNLAWNGFANSATDPRFVARATTLDATNVNYQLQAGSAAINTGSVIGTYTRDGITVPPFNESISGSAPDRGAYEYGGTPWSAGANYSQCFPPEFSLASGNYASAVTVTLTSPTPSATIYYTTDGSMPSSTVGTLYSSAISVSSATTLKAIAYKSGMTDSAVTTAVYTINASPVISADQSASGTVNADFSYQVIASNSPTSYALTSGTLPAGVSLDVTTGVLRGTPTAAVTSTPLITATNASGTSAPVIITLTIAPSPGTLLSHEDFDYTASTSITGLTGGTGWRSPSNSSWTSAGTTGTVAASGLTYTAINPAYTSFAPIGLAGNYGGILQNSRLFAIDAGDAYATAGLKASDGNYIGGGTVSGTLWGSYLVAANSWSSPQMLFNLDSTAGTGTKISIRQTAAGSAISVTDALGNSIGATGSIPTASLSTTKPNLIVFRYVFNGASNDTLHVWLNPTSATDTPAISVTASNFIINTLTLRSVNANGGLVFDEIRLGTTFAIVTPYSATPPATTPA
ncbi:MAG: chitobiase/beta-hexosaminidase C-terminal domain-containing protein, partial [Burkholderiales bacterium]|nr:chitobiase/beta-hexosaminidase C-terminal domain-containing protein [Opitutaceae bacterium]